MKKGLGALSLLLTPVLAHAEAFPVDRCVNLDQALEAPVEGEWGYVIARDDIAWIADAGFDTVRLPVRFSAHWDGALDPAILGRVDEVIGWAMDEGLQVILDLHHFEELLADPVTHRQTFVAIWQELGAHYAGFDDRLIFELLNEPSENLDTGQAVAMFQEVFADLRPQHPDRWIVIEGGDWAHLDALPDLSVIDDRTVLSFHYYTPFQFTHQLASWHENPMPPAVWGTAKERAALRADFAQAAQIDAPLLLGEFGVTSPTDLSERVNWIKAVREAAEAYQIGWCHWGFAKGFAVYDLDAGDWLPGMKGALIPD